MGEIITRRNFTQGIFSRDKLFCFFFLGGGNSGGKFSTQGVSVKNLNNDQKSNKKILFSNESMLKNIFLFGKIVLKKFSWVNSQKGSNFQG